MNAHPFPVKHPCVVRTQWSPAPDSGIECTVHGLAREGVWATRIEVWRYEKGGQAFWGWQLVDPATNEVSDVTYGAKSPGGAQMLAFRTAVDRFEEWRK